MHNHTAKKLHHAVAHKNFAGLLVPVGVGHLSVYERVLYILMTQPVSYKGEVCPCVKHVGCDRVFEDFEVSFLFGQSCFFTVGFHQLP